jgi:hypothetical protein
MAYLQDLCRRRLTLQLGEEAPECWFEEVLYDFAAFVKAQHGDPARILLARNYVLPDQAASLSDVAALLTGCVHARKLAVSCKKKGYDFLTRCDNDTIFLPQHALTVISRKLAAPAIDIERFLAALSDGKVLISQDEQGWFLDASWFDYQLKQTGLDQRFGIVG